MPKTYRVVVADDEPNSLATLQNYLVQAGHFAIAEAHSSDELIQHCQATRPDLIITDAKLGGVDVLSAVGNLFDAQNIPALIVSTHQNDELIDRAIACGVFGFLVKPIRAEDLTVAVTAAMGLFEEFQVLRKDAAEMRQNLEDRKIIEQAKGVIMRKRELDEASRLPSFTDNGSQKPAKTD